MQGNEQQRGGLRRRIAARWTPLFEDEDEVTPITDEEFAAACDWERLRTTGAVAAHEEPLGIAGLRRSSIFPRHLLRRRDDGRLVPIAFDEAVALVRLTLALEGRGQRSADVLDGTDTVTGPDEHPAGHATTTDTTTDTTFDTADEPLDTEGAEGASDTKADAARGRRRFFRRRD